MRTVLLFLLAIFPLANVQASEEQQTIDRVAIERAVENWNAAWKIKDPGLAARDYSDSADWTHEGQRDPTGQDIGQRRTSHLRVFAKADGHWQIISHLISDARDTRNPAH